MKQKIINIINIIPYDKQLHILLGTYLFLFLLVFFNPHIAMILTSLAGALVELVYDKWWGKGTPEVMDWVATTVGGMVPYLIIIRFVL